MFLNACYLGRTFIFDKHCDLRACEIATVGLVQTGMKGLVWGQACIDHFFELTEEWFDVNRSKHQHQGGSGVTVVWCG